MSWYSKSSIVWYLIFLLANWDSLVYSWNDSVCTWDASIGRDEWRTKNPVDWYTEN